MGPSPGVLVPDAGGARETFRQMGDRRRRLLEFPAGATGSDRIRDRHHRILPGRTYVPDRCGRPRPRDRRGGVVPRRQAGCRRRPVESSPFGRPRRRRGLCGRRKDDDSFTVGQAGLLGRALTDPVRGHRPPSVDLQPQLRPRRPRVFRADRQVSVNAASRLGDHLRHAARAVNSGTNQAGTPTRHRGASASPPTPPGSRIYENRVATALAQPGIRTLN